MPTRETLLIQIIHFLAEKLKTAIVLEGGMLLRLLNCPRATQDVDFIWVSSESKKVLAKRLVDLLAAWDAVTVQAVRLNSRGIFIDVVSATQPTIGATIEVNVQPSLHLPAQGISTALVARTHAIGGRIVRAMALAEALAHKIAAALERRNARDLYDISQLEPLTPFDPATLRQRLATLSINRGKPRAVTGKQAAVLLKARYMQLTEAALAEELYPLLPRDQRAGLLPILQAAVSRIVARLEAWED